MSTVAKTTPEQQALYARQRAYVALLGELEGIARPKGYTLQRLTDLGDRPLEASIRPIGDRLSEGSVVQGDTPVTLVAALAALPDHVTTTRHS